MKKAFVIVALAGLGASAQAGLVTTRIEANPAGARSADNTLSANEYGAGNSQSYAGNAASGFGGTVGNGTVYMGASNTNWQVGWQPGGNVNDLFVIYFNVDSGGTITSQNGSDTSDGGRRASTLPASGSGASVNYPITVSHTLVFGNFGAVLFSLAQQPGGFPGQITFLQFTGSASNGAAGNSGFREVSIPYATIGGVMGSTINWFGLYTSEGGYLSNESIPGTNAWTGNLDGGTNPGLNAGTLTIANYNRFIPTPGAMALLGLGGLVAGRRRR
jgi:hypothetical protein